eukprot:6195492-Pleurochrysis_carterae.AAC.1
MKLTLFLFSLAALCVSCQDAKKPSLGSSVSKGAAGSSTDENLALGTQLLSAVVGNDLAAAAEVFTTASPAQAMPASSSFPLSVCPCLPRSLSASLPFS